MTEMSASTKYETLLVSEFCLEGMITIGLIYRFFLQFPVKLSTSCLMVDGSGPGSGIFELNTNYSLILSSEVPVLDRDIEADAGAGAESRPSYRSATPLPASILSLMQFAIESSLLPGVTHVSWIELLNASLWIMLSLSTATAAPT